MRGITESRMIYEIKKDMKRSEKRREKNTISKRIKYKQNKLDQMKNN